MCPDPQLLSVYMDGELPSPWKEKMEAHLSECPACSEKIKSFRLFHKDAVSEQELMEAAKNRVWEKLQSRKPIRPFAGNSANERRFPSGLMQKRLSIPLPAAAAAAVIIMLMTALVLRGGQTGNDGLAGSFAAESAGNYGAGANFFLSAEEEIPALPVADIDSVLQYLSSDGSDIIILRMPETRSFSVTGEPAIIRAADFPRHQPNTRRHQ